MLGSNHVNYLDFETTFSARNLLSSSCVHTAVYLHFKAPLWPLYYYTFYCQGTNSSFTIWPWETSKGQLSLYVCVCVSGVQNVGTKCNQEFLFRISQVRQSGVSFEQTTISEVIHSRGLGPITQQTATAGEIQRTVGVTVQGSLTELRVNNGTKREFQKSMS